MPLFKRLVVSILTWEARLALRRFDPKIVAVTGSVGKTTTKDAIYAAISGSESVRKSEKSFNSELGVPLTILGLESGWRNPFKWVSNVFSGFFTAAFSSQYPEWLVLEVGADRPGDIRTIAAWLRPDVAVITAIPEIPVHVEFFDSPEAVLREKKALADHLKPGGTLIINGDDPRLSDMKSSFKGRTISAGFSADCDVEGSEYRIAYDGVEPCGIAFKASSAGASEEVLAIGALGRPRAYAALLAIAAASCVGVDLQKASRALAQWQPTPGRMRLLKGIRGSIVIDDTYNSSPAAALEALDTLKSVATAGKRIAVLGDMLELGKFSADAHRAIGERAAQCCDELITVGFRSRATGESALDGGLSDQSIREYEQGESDRAGIELQKELQRGDVVLVKGSQSMRMEKTVAALLLDQTKAGELLVRQDEAWKSR